MIERCTNLRFIDWLQDPDQSFSYTESPSSAEKIPHCLLLPMFDPLANTLALLRTGTGKTFVSTEAIRVLLANRKAEDPPIIVVSGLTGRETS